MKIKEAVNIINSTNTAAATTNHDNLQIYDLLIDNKLNWFITMPIKAISWKDVSFDNHALESVSPADLARVMDVIQRLLDTPAEERYPEKSYLLVAKRETSFQPKYVSNIITGFDELVFDLSKDEKEARIFSEKELNQIKEREPSLAPAIDSMKEEVKDDDND